MKEIRLKRGVWKYDPSDPLGPEGGFGAVYAGQSEDGEPVAVKRLKISAQDAAHRELRIADELTGGSFQHVLPIFDSGQDTESGRYFVVMPRAEQSLQERIEREKKLDERQTVSILLQIANGLQEVFGFVHRDLKPGNVLLHAGYWKIADFGIARFVEESTSLQTLKQCLSPPYAAPEQWRLERATAATDVYALGCIGYTLLTGSPPFGGPAMGDYQRQHLNEDPPTLSEASPQLRSLLTMMLRKVPAARPSIRRVKSILDSVLEGEEGDSEGGWNALAQAGAEVAKQESQEEARKEREASKRQRRHSLASSAMKILNDLTEELFQRITEAAPSAQRISKRKIILGRAALEITAMRINPISGDAFPRTGWDVIAGAVIGVEQSDPPYIWSSSLWHVRRHESDDYRWQEASYFRNPFSSKRPPKYEPYSIGVPADADEAHAPIMGVNEVAWGPTPIDDEDAEDFFKRWADLFARAAKGNLGHPSRLPLDR